MRYLIAYDIRDRRRLRRVARICEDFGIRVEYSVFECDLDEDRFLVLWGELENVMDRHLDVILSYRLCAACLDSIRTLGQGAMRPPPKPAVYCI